MLNSFAGSSEFVSQTQHKFFSQILKFRSNWRRRRLSPAAKTFVASASLFVLATFLMTPSYGMGIRQGDYEAQSRAVDEWVKSDVRTLEKIISNLYGRENPFNLLSKRGGVAKHSANAASKFEKRFTKHDSQIALLKPHNGKIIILHVLNYLLIFAKNLKLFQE